MSPQHKLTISAGAEKQVTAFPRETGQPSTSAKFAGHENNNDDMTQIAIAYI